MPRVKVDGTFVHFPDGTSPEYIEAVLRNGFQNFRSDLTTAAQHLKGLAEQSVIIGAISNMRPEDMAAMIPGGVGDVLGPYADYTDIRDNWQERDWTQNAAAGIGAALGALPFVPSRSQAKAIAAGFKTPAYHGTTHDIREFDGRIANPESDWGRGTYATTSVDDAGENYAGVGPDLTNRIELESERIADWLADDDYTRAELLDEIGWTEAQYFEDEAGAAREIAKRNLVGDAGEGGAMYPLQINTDNYAVIGGPNSTRMEFPEPDLDGIPEDSDEYYEAIDAARDEAFEQIYDALYNSDIGQDESTVGAIMESLADYMDDGLDLSDLDEAIRRNASDAYDDMGELVSGGGISAQVLQNLGYDGVIDNTVNAKFGKGRQYGGGMAGMDENTQHIITFPGKENKVRSKFARFDPNKLDSKDILASMPPAVAASYLLRKEEEDSNR